MSKTIFRPFWSFDAVRTEEWLSAMHAKGYALQKIHFASRRFVFEETAPVQTFYRIVYDKNTNGAPEIYLQDGVYDQVCFSKNFYVLRTEKTSPAMAPSYEGFLKRNKMIGLVAGFLLLALFVMSLFPLMIFFVVFSVFAFTSLSINDVMQVMLNSFIPLLITILTIFTFLKLLKTNRQLEKLCGDTLDLDFTVPKDTLMSKSETIRLRRSGQLIEKTRFAWQYAPDKIEIWLEQMAQDGYHLNHMSISKSFFFLKGEPYQAKYHVDYQNRTDPSYFNLNKEAGWKLYFTSLSRFLNLSVWGQEYKDAPPMFYSDSDSKIKHARKFALTYSLCFFPVCLIYLLLIVVNVIYVQPHFGLAPMLVVQNLSFLLLILELGFFATRTILYYFRVKKTVTQD